MRAEWFRGGLALAVAAVALVVALSTAAPVLGRAAASTLQLDAVFHATASVVPCPGGTPETTTCVDATGTAPVPGLGSATETFSETSATSGSCTHTTFGDAVIEIAGKGELHLALDHPSACDPPLGDDDTGTFTVTGGTGPYAGATGSGTLSFTDFRATGPTTATETHTWTGQITANSDFDTTPPLITGAKPVVVKTRKRAVRVHYTPPTATDAADGTVPVHCRPKSGSRFSIGRTRVNCSATDSSDNTASASFTVTVKHKR